MNDIDIGVAHVNDLRISTEFYEHMMPATSTKVILGKDYQSANGMSILDLIVMWPSSMKRRCVPM